MLSIRIRERDEAARKSALARQKVREALDHLAWLEACLKKADAELDDKKARNILDGEALHLHGLCCAGLSIDMEVAEIAIMKANLAADQAAKELAEAHKATEVLEKLKEKEFETWQKEELRKEAIAMDEVAVTRFLKKES